MSSAGPRIDRYLRWVAGQLLSEPGELTVVRGGAAMDADSLAGSLAYAFLLHQEQEMRPGRTGRLVAPLLPISRGELRLRPEVLALLEAAEIPLKVLGDTDTLELSTYPRERLALVLVDSDGRELPTGLRRRVVEILDHHVPAVRPPTGARRIVAQVGSACTLVAEQIQERLPALLERRLALLLLGPILLDAVNLDPAAGRVTDRDRRAGEQLRAAAGAAADGLYARLREARARLQGLSGTDLLRRDYKESAAGGVRIGTASVPLSVQEWLSRERDPEACLRSFAAERGLALLAVMFAFDEERPTGRSGAGQTEPGQSGPGLPEGEFRRQLLVLVRGAGRRYAALLRFLGGLGLGLRPLPGLPGSAGAGSASPEWRLGLFEQDDTAFSRKRLEPELRRFCRIARAAGRGEAGDGG